MPFIYGKSLSLSKKRKKKKKSIVEIRVVIFL